MKHLKIALLTLGIIAGIFVFFASPDSDTRDLLVGFCLSVVCGLWLGITLGE